MIQNQNNGASGSLQRPFILAFVCFVCLATYFSFYSSIILMSERLQDSELLRTDFEIETFKQRYQKEQKERANLEIENFKQQYGEKQKKREQRRVNLEIENFKQQYEKEQKKKQQEKFGEFEVQKLKKTQDLQNKTRWVYHPKGGASGNTTKINVSGEGKGHNMRTYSEKDDYSSTENVTLNKGKRISQKLNVDGKLFKKQEVQSISNPAQPQNTTEEIPTLLGCKEIEKLEIIRTIGKGNAKIVYEVKLLSGEHAVAKRCRNRKCDEQQRPQDEARLLRNLYEQYNDKAITFYGECYGRERYRFRKTESKFSVGYTSIVELAKPLIPSWLKNTANEKKQRSCFASYFTDADLEGLRIVARQYANYSPSPIVMYKKGWKDTTDNIYAEQYILTKAGLRHGDTDMVQSFNNFTYEEALKENCQVVSKVAHIAMNCSLEFSVENPIHFPDDHINIAEATSNCINDTPIRSAKRP